MDPDALVLSTGAPRSAVLETSEAAVTDDRKTWLFVPRRDRRWRVVADCPVLTQAAGAASWPRVMVASPTQPVPSTSPGAVWGRRKNSPRLAPPKAMPPPSELPIATTMPLPLAVPSRTSRTSTLTPVGAAKVVDVGAVDGAAVLNWNSLTVLAPTWGPAKSHTLPVVATALPQ